MRVFGRIEKLLLAVIGGFGFMFLATTPLPGLQTLVASVACPSGTTEAAVVRYPHVVEPAGMVRNSPLVCVVDGQAVLASHARVLPSLVIVGAVGSLAVVVALSLAVAAARRGSARAETPPAPKSTLETMRWVWLMVTTPFAFMTAFGLYWWLAVDTPYRRTSCQSSDGGSATCFDGETVYRSGALLFGALLVAGLVIWGITVMRSTKRSRRFARVWSEGVRATATLVEVSATSTEINDQRVYRFTYEVKPVDGSAPFRFTEKGIGSPAGSEGGSTAIVYDRGDTSIAFTLTADLAAARHPEGDAKSFSAFGT